MVRPNQIIASDIDDNSLTFIIFAQSQKQAARRVMMVNFPVASIPLIVSGTGLTDPVTETRVVSEGTVNRYAVTVDTSRL